MSIFLGFCDEKIKSHSSESKGDEVSFTTSKIGGIPILPDGKSISISCSNCSKQCPLVCQINSPVDEKYNRTLYVFSCTELPCQRSSNGWTVLRVMLPHTKHADNNTYNKVTITNDDWGCPEADDWGCPDANDWGSETVDDWSNKVPNKWSATKTDLCAPNTPSIVSSSIDEPSNYCVDSNITSLSSSVEKLSISCNTSSSNTTTYDDYFIAVHEEETESGDYMDKQNENLLIKYGNLEDSVDNSNRKKGGANSTATEKYEKTEVIHGDKTFYKFTKCMSKNPLQIIRYEFGGNPMPMTSLDLSKIPRCECCQSSRCFECQLMPALLQRLEINSNRSPIDAGTAIIYSCSSNCYQEQITLEHIIIQHDPDEHLLVKLKNHS